MSARTFWDNLTDFLPLPSKRLPWYQFSLLTVLVLMTLVFVLLAFWNFVIPLLSLIAMMATMLLIPAFLAGIIYGRDDDRAFAIGGLAATLTFMAFPTLWSTFSLPFVYFPVVWVWIFVAAWMSRRVRNVLMDRYDREEKV